MQAAGGHLAGVQEGLALGGAEPRRHRDDAVHRRLALRGGLRDAPRVLQDARLRKSRFGVHVLRKAQVNDARNMLACAKTHCAAMEPAET